MTEVLGLEHVRKHVSAHLTEILTLFGQLRPDYNVRYLPGTVSAIASMIRELELIEKKYYGFSEILQENLESTEKHSRAFLIPDSLRRAPDLRGLRTALYELTWPLIKSYCREEKEFLVAGPGVSVSSKSRKTLLKRTRRNCEQLFAWCLPQESILLLELKVWCENQMADV